jgi:putative tricarboxylic transport membrane protein
MDENPDLAWGLIGSMYLGNTMLLALNVFCIPLFASLARVPFRMLAPIIIVVCALGTYTVNGSIVEVGIMFACGVIGFFMRKYGFSPAATVIAVVLGPLAEETLRQTMIISGGSFDIFLERGLSQALLAVIVVLLLLPLVTRRLTRRRPEPAVEPAPAAEPVSPRERVQARG